MKIVIIGAGKVGYKLTGLLSAEEDYEVVLIDPNEDKLKKAFDQFDIMCIVGDGTDAEILTQAGADSADLVVTCTSTDEVNMLSCLIAKKLGAHHTIARVRNPIYYQQMKMLKDDLHLSMAINPEFAIADEIARAFLIPGALKVEPFLKGKVELVEHVIKHDSPLCGIKLADIYKTHQIRLLICAVRHGSEIIIPDGETVLQEGDHIHIVAAHKNIKQFFKMLGSKYRETNKVMICGGGRVGYYLAKQLSNAGMKVKVIEKDRKIAEHFCEKLPKVQVICGNASNHELLKEEGLAEADAMVNLVGVDEENIILGLLGKSLGVPNVVAKVNDETRAALVEDLLDNVVSSKSVTAEAIMHYIRARQNSQHQVNVEAMYLLVGEQLQALEFIVREETAYTNIALKDLPIKPNNLIACIGRDGHSIIPGGNDMILPGDSVVVVSTQKRVEDIADILK